MPFDPTRYREIIDHLDDHAHQVWHGDAEEMDAALRAARMLPEAIAELESVRDYLERSSFDVRSNISMVADIDNVLAAIEESPNATAD